MTLTIMSRPTFARRSWLAVGLLLAVLGCSKNGCSKDDANTPAKEAEQAPPSPSPLSVGAAKFVDGRLMRGTPNALAGAPEAGSDYDAVSVSADVDSDSGGAPFTATFTAEVEGGPPGLRYRWEFGDETPAVAQTLVVQHTYQRTGEYTATFSVTGPPETGVEESREINIEVTEEGFDFDIETDSDVGAAPLTVEFTARLDEDLPGPFYFQWEFGDGARDVSNPTTHVYRKPGEYTATVTVTNAQGQKATRDVQITADAPDETQEEQ